MIEDKLVLSSMAVNATGLIQLEAPAGTFQIEGLGPDGAAHGRNSVNLGLRFLIPGLLLALGLLGVVPRGQLPAFADFLIAVEAEMNKVPGPPEASCSAPRWWC